MDSRPGDQTFFAKMKLFLQRKEDFFKSLKSTENGLTSSEVEAKLQEFGKNGNMNCNTIVKQAIFNRKI